MEIYECKEFKKKKLFIEDVMVWLITAEKCELTQVYRSQLPSAASEMY